MTLQPYSSNTIAKGKELIMDPMHPKIKTMPIKNEYYYFLNHIIIILLIGTKEHPHPIPANDLPIQPVNKLLLMPHIRPPVAAII